MHPEVSLFQADLASTCNDLGNLHTDEQRRDLAQPCYEEARGLWEKLVQANPSVNKFRRDLASVYSNLGLLESESRRHEAALICHRQACDLLREITKMHPENPGYRNDLGCALNNLGRTLAAQGRHEDALPIFTEAIAEQRRALAKAPQIAPFRLFLSYSYLNMARSQRQLSRAADAVATTLQRRELWPRDPAELYKVARDLALCIPIVAGGKAELTDVEQAERDQYATAAVEILRQAMAAGFHDGARLSKDADFEPLRSRGDFQKLLADLAEDASSRNDSAKPSRR
jgi:tetratricopeptide (TPR) repeat protein